MAAEDISKLDIEEYGWVLSYFNRDQHRNVKPVAVRLAGARFIPQVFLQLQESGVLFRKAL